MSVNSHLIANNPVWTDATVVTDVAAAGAWPGPGTPVPSLVPIILANGQVATSVTISNTGPVNLYVGSLTNHGILLQPGAAISLALSSSAAPYVHDLTPVTGTGTWAVVAYE